MPNSQVYEVVKEVIAEILPDVNPEMISIEKRLTDLGANSIDRMEIVTMSMERLGLVIPMMGFAHVSNIEGLVNVLTDNYASGK